MAEKCPHCGEQLEDNARFCGVCGTRLEIIKMVKHDLLQGEDGAYHWIYELPMLKSLFLLLEVWKVILFSVALIVVFFGIVTIVMGDGLDSMIGLLQVTGIVLAIILVLSIPAYLIVVYVNNGKYTVLFTMDEEGIDHTQIKTDKAKALEQLTVAIGSRAGSYSTAGAGMLSAGGGSLYSKFSRVKKIKGYPTKHLIRVNGRFVHNQIYVKDRDYSFVFKYISNHCPQAKIDEAR